MKSPLVKMGGGPNHDADLKVYAGATRSGQPFVAYTHPTMEPVVRLVMPSHPDWETIAAAMADHWPHGRICQCCPPEAPPPANDDGAQSDQEPA